MPLPSASNPILRRLNLLQDQWTRFVLDPSARLLRWVVAPDEVCMVEALWARESDDSAAETPDLFLRLRAAFEDPEQHGLSLKSEFAQMLEKAQEALGEESSTPVARWTCPAPPPEASDVQALVAALESFRAAHAPSGGLVGVWLDPEKVDDQGLCSAWLLQLAKAASAACRFVVLDDPTRPLLEGLARAEPVRVRSALADLDMPAAQEEISRQTGDLDTPGGLFRHLFIQMSNAAKKGDAAIATALADRAAAIAQEQRWPTLAAAAHMAVGGVLAQGAPQGAMARYRVAEGLAAKSAAEGDQRGVSLRLGARMANGAVLISTGELGQAADWYRATVPFAEAANDARSVVDCWRLASYCHEQSGAFEAAWEAGIAGFEVGRKLDAEARKTSTLPYLAEGLMRLTSRRPLRDHAQAMEQQIVAVLGEDWWPTSESSARPAAAANSRGR